MERERRLEIAQQIRNVRDLDRYIASEQRLWWTKDRFAFELNMTKRRLEMIMQNPPDGFPEPRRPMGRVLFHRDECHAWINSRR